MSQGGWLRVVDPRAKTLACLLVLAGVGAGNGWASSAWLLAGVAALAARLRVGYLLQGLAPVAALCLMGLILNGIAIGGRVLHPLLPLSVEGVTFGAKLSSQLFAAATLARILAYSTEPGEVVSSLNWIFSPLKRLGIPVEDFFMTVSAALSLLPTMRTMAFTKADVGPSKAEFSLAALSKRWSDILRGLLKEADSTYFLGIPNVSSKVFGRFKSRDWLTLAFAAAFSAATVLT